MAPDGATAPSSLPYELAPVVGEDLPSLYTFAGTVTSRWHRVCGAGHPTFPAFERLLYERVHSLDKVVIGTALVGVSAFYRVDHLSRTGHLDVILADPHASTAALPRLVQSRLAHAAKQWQLRKVYVTHAGYETPPLADVEVVWREEARLRDAVLHESYHWDLVTSAALLDPALHDEDWHR